MGPPRTANSDDGIEVAVAERQLPAFTNRYWDRSETKSLCSTGSPGRTRFSGTPWV